MADSALQCWAEAAPGSSSVVRQSGDCPHRVHCMSEEADRTSIRAATLAGTSNNQDRYVVGDRFAAVLDGSTSVAGDRSHDPGWYAEQLAQALSESVQIGRAHV